MTPWLFAGITIAGGVGACARFAVDFILRTSGQLRTFLINVSGSLLLGFLTGLALKGLVTPDWKLVLGTGILGGYTTFSTASVDAVRLAQSNGRGASVALGPGKVGSIVYALGTMTCAIVGAAIGWFIADAM